MTRRQAERFLLAVAFLLPVLLVGVAPVLIPVLFPPVEQAQADDWAGDTCAEADDGC